MGPGPGAAVCGDVDARGLRRESRWLRWGFVCGSAGGRRQLARGKHVGLGSATTPRPTCCA